jgi:hypothetical protein
MTRAQRNVCTRIWQDKYDQQLTRERSGALPPMPLDAQKFSYRKGSRHPCDADRHAPLGADFAVLIRMFLAMTLKPSPRLMPLSNMT